MQSINNSAQQSAANDGRGPRRGCAARPACANARWHGGAMPGGPGRALPDHALDAAHVSSHARFLAQRRWGTGCAATAADAQPLAQGIAVASAAAPPRLAGGAGWLPWLALGGSLAALIGAEVERRRASDANQTGLAEARISFTAIVLYVLAALLAGLAIYLF